MKRKRPVHLSPTKKRPRGRRNTTPNTTQLENRFAVLMLLLQHNIDKLLRRTRRS